MPLVYMINLFDYQLLSFTIADMFIVILLIYAVSKQKTFVLYKYHVALICLWVITGLFSIINLWYFDYYTIEGFIMPYAKFLIYIIAFIVLPQYFAKSFTELNRIIITSITILCLLGLYQFIAHHIFPFLPYSLAPESIASRPGYFAMTSYGIFRIKGIYSEPAHFGIYLNLLYAYIIHNDIRLKSIGHLLIITTIILTLSVSGILLLLLNVLLLVKKHGLLNLKQAFSGFFLLCGLVAISYNIDFIFNRLTRIITLSEGSASKRLLGGFELASYFPMHGVGIGRDNFIHFYHSFEKTLIYAESPDNIHNIFIVVYSYSGVLGVLLFAIFLFMLFKHNISLGLLVITAFFATGLFNAPDFWVPLIFIATGEFYRVNYASLKKDDFEIRKKLLSK